MSPFLPMDMSPSTAAESLTRSKRRKILPESGSTASSAALPSSSFARPENPGMAEVLSQSTLRCSSQETASVGQPFPSAPSGTSDAEQVLSLGFRRKRVWWRTLLAKNVLEEL